MSDTAHMDAALALARRGQGTAWPNPSVGCVIVRDGRVVGRGVTAEGGRPHAETVALGMAGQAALGATAYVTLEPCSHHGKTPPCAQALIEAGIARVVVAMRDPDPRVDGRGIAMLADAGIEVSEGVRQAEAEEQAIGFVLRITQGRPLVTLKLATTLDGKIATRTGESQWITGEAARKTAHALRGSNDAVLVGVGTVLADNPMLTCRIEGMRGRPVVRVVLDSHLRTPLTAALVASAVSAPAWIIHRHDADRVRQAGFASAGVRLFPVAASAGTGIEPGAALAALAEAGITSVLVEGGGKVAASFLRAGLVDRVAWFHAPAVLGADGWPAVQGLGIGALSAMPRLERQRVTRLGGDVLTELRRIGECSPES
jgi:diaminohydroxyphosphoribosylaminopyrimidine deaminase/5-amino-6-(5-phosphoribosylamino)uracil reductase